MMLLRIKCSRHIQSYVSNQNGAPKKWKNLSSTSQTTWPGLDLITNVSSNNNNKRWLIEEMNVLVDYSDSDDSDHCEAPSWDTQHHNKQKRKLSPNRKEELLPLPDAIRKLSNKSSKKKHTDNPDAHHGRVRSFQHIEGNWATHVHIPYNAEYRIKEKINEMCDCLHPLEFHAIEEPHISLSRTVILRHHWIQSFTDSLLKKFKVFNRTYCELSKVKILTNDDKTRSFLAIESISHDSMLPKLVEVVDESLAEYRLEKYYMQPSFHISMAWCLGAISEDVDSQKLCQIQEMFDNVLQEEPDLRIVPIEEIRCKTGNKEFNYSLNANSNY